MIRQVGIEGGFGTVIKKGERDAGTILVVLVENGKNSRVYERMPTLDGDRIWSCSVRETEESRETVEDYLQRRGHQDPDLWIIELDIARGERFIGLSDGIG